MWPVDRTLESTFINFLIFKAARYTGYIPLHFQRECSKLDIIQPDTVHMQIYKPRSGSSYPDWYWLFLAVRKLSRSCFKFKASLNAAVLEKPNFSPPNSVRDSAANFPQSSPPFPFDRFQYWIIIFIMNARPSHKKSHEILNPLVQWTKLPSNQRKI